MQIGNFLKNLEGKYKSHKFREIKFDSRNCKDGDIFFAIDGINKNGNNFIKEAIKNNAKTIISNNKYQGLKNGLLFISHKNPRKLLAEFIIKSR